MGERVVIDIGGVPVEVTAEEVAALRDAAAERAGRSSLARDLSLLLDRALSGKRLALRRIEGQTLLEVAVAAGVAPDLLERLRRNL